MLFNSYSYALFLPIVFMLYWFVFHKKLRNQNALLLITSYYFYACWDWRFLFLLLFSTLLDFISGIKMYEAKTKSKKRIWFWLSIVINLGFLGIFKYFNFFAASFKDLFANWGITVHPWTLSIVLPVGISFYTFHGLSYVIDIYKEKIKAERNFIDYAVFVSFFPLLVAGPIERATHLLPQIKQKRTFDYPTAVDGLKQILWGLFKKIVIADTCARYVDYYYTYTSYFSGLLLVLAAVAFAIQIYCDFSGYSDIAIGTARLFGIQLLRNFAYPYFSRSIAEFWRRWHLSLTTWFRDYLYIPLGGSKGGIWRKARNVLIIFLVSGFWHGANWTFIIWGALNALFFLPSIFNSEKHLPIEQDVVAKGKNFPSFNQLLQMTATFGLATIGFIFFRAENVPHALQYFSAMCSNSGSFLLLSTYWRFKVVIVMAFILFLIEWIGREQPYAIQNIGQNWKPIFRYSFYYSILLAIYWYSGSEQQFIYFQF